MVMFVQRQDTGPWLRERGFESLTSPQTTGLVVPRVKVSGCLPDQTGSSPVPGEARSAQVAELGDAPAREAGGQEP